MPDKKCFYSFVKDGTIGDNGEKLDGHITDGDYLTCNKIRNEFNMKNMSDYHNHYLRKNVLLLADLFEKFTDMCLKFYKLYPCHYSSSPGLSWDPMSKMIDVGLEKISDIGMYLFIGKVLRGGISYIAIRHSEANNNYMKNYDPNKWSKFIECLDKNCLYGWGMNCYLPYGGFQWLKTVDIFYINSISEKSPIGYIVEVYLEYLDQLHKLYNDYPLAPEKLAIPYRFCEIIFKILLTNMKKKLVILKNHFQI